VAKATLVVHVAEPFCSYDTEHQRRRRLGHVTTYADGNQYVWNHCTVIVSKANFGR
jgi:hypothetical protein